MNIERRHFLKIAGATAATAAIATILPDYALYDRFESLKRERLRYLPPQRISLPDRSIIIGTAPDPRTPDYVEQFEDKLNITPGIIHHFIELGKDPIEPMIMKMQNNLDLGYLPMISFGPHKNRPKSQKAMDELIDQMGYLAGPVLIRPWFEANGVWTKDWYGMNVDEYKTAWEKLHTQCQEKILEPYLVYAPNVSSLYSSGNVLSFVPDPRFFDFLGLDLYNKKSIFRTDPRYYAYDFLTPEMEMGRDIYDFLHNERTFNKPLIITEINASVEIYRGAWMAEAYRYAALHGACAIVSFDHNKKGVAWDEADWRLTNNRDVINNLSNEFMNRYYYRGHMNAKYTVELMKAQKLNEVLLPKVA